MKIFCFSPFGYEGNLVSIEVDLRRGIPAVDIVGLADGAVKESRERMRCAIINSGLIFPPERILVSLSPADLKKEGAGFDLAVALAVLDAKDCLENFKNSEEGESVLVMGELELNGNIRPVRSVNAAAATALACGITYCIVPAPNMNEALSAGGMKVFGAENLVQAYNALTNPASYTAGGESSFCVPEEKGWHVIDGVAFPPFDPEFEFEQVVGQQKLVRALQIAAAGGHNLLAYGPPGCGKTLSLQKYSCLLPALDDTQSHTVTRIYSLAGLVPPGVSVIRKPPFRMPHQTASIEGICGGGPHCIPGEISLAHNGVLFLDEAAEFRSAVLQMLRVPLEGGHITLSRAGRSTVYPADFQLLMATNPCPCGNYGSEEKVCLCSSRAVEQYWKKFSGPLLDRIDLRVQVHSEGKVNRVGEKGISTAELRIQIARAHNIQRQRQDKKNSKMTPAQVEEFCVLSSGARTMVEKASAKNDFSRRAFDGCLKLARTIADMRGAEIIEESDMEEAVMYRKGGITI